jgi:hypothetical protein
MRCLSKWLIAIAISAITLFGQSLAIPPSGTDRKTPGMFLVTINSPSGKAPVALQWEFWVPPVIAINAAEISIGTAAESSGKSLKCVTKAHVPGRRRGFRCACILAGGEAQIANGPIAVVQYRVQWDLKGSQVQVAVENVLGVSQNATPIPMANADGVIDVW